ncbi:MAG: hypothetical protein AAGF48_07620 [Pseudomonadota bacterium]
MAVTTGMIGHGFYNQNSEPQWAATEYVLPWTVDAALSMDLSDPPHTVGLGDFGCSEGRNSVTVFQSLVEACRKRTTRPIQTVHSDLPTNDFSELFERLRPEGQSFFGDSVYSGAVGGSMYDQLLPPRSLHFATTFNAIGFLSERPLDRLPGYILPNGPSAVRGVGTVAKTEQAMFARQAASDLESFLASRSAELVPGGKLLIQVFGAGPERRTCDGLYDVLNDALLEHVAEGLISQDTYETFYQPVYFRTLHELTAPVAEASAPCASLFLLERAESYEVPVAFVEDYSASGDIGTYARAYTNFFRAFTEPVLRLHLGEDCGPVVVSLYDRAESLLRNNPERYPFHYVAHAMLLTRRL